MMIMTTAEQIYTLVKALPQEQASEILAFVEFIRTKHSITHQLSNSADTSTPWPELVSTLAGAWADDFPSPESIRTDIGQDVLRESL
jgi:hypothetical protein